MNLLKQIRQFGLNPKDWNLKLNYVGPGAPLAAELRHRELADLVLNGQCFLKEGQGQLVFNDLTLSSL